VIPLVRAIPKTGHDRANHLIDRFADLHFHNLALPFGNATPIEI
jgi:hypothetical protein